MMKLNGFEKGIEECYCNCFAKQWLSKVLLGLFQVRFLQSWVARRLVLWEYQSFLVRCFSLGSWNLLHRSYSCCHNSIGCLSPWLQHFHREDKTQAIPMRPSYHRTREEAPPWIGHSRGWLRLQAQCELS